MIEAVYNRGKKTLSVHGHSGYAPRGRDIVCAGVSTLVYTLINSTECVIDGETVTVKGNGVILDAVVCGLNMIAEKFPENLLVKEEK